MGTWHQRMTQSVPRPVYKAIEVQKTHQLEFTSQPGSCYNSSKCDVFFSPNFTLLLTYHLLYNVLQIF
jgi:hypothetical protein